jgi:hypothetical protein
MALLAREALSELSGMLTAQIAGEASREPPDVPSGQHFTRRRSARKAPDL